jgi:hypothetical protein
MLLPFLYLVGVPPEVRLLLGAVSVLHNLLSDVLIGRSCPATPDTTLRIGMDQEDYAARARSRAELSYR